MENENKTIIPNTQQHPINANDQNNNDNQINEEIEYDDIVQMFADVDPDILENQNENENNNTSQQVLT
jgi:hypothetical protein